MEHPVAKVRDGNLRGLKEFSYGEKPFHSFCGVPYAKPPIGKLRFKAPQPADPWGGILDALQEKPACSQHNIHTNDYDGSEDCLYLNIYAPEHYDPDKLYPVMFWIHGGGFYNGSGNRILYGPEYLMDHDIVLVTVTYRVGIFGFLSLENPALEIPGNAGMKDQVMALKWVQANISNFGGDPKNVTIFGESAGGASVHLHVLSSMSKGLFHKAIIQSGVASCPWVFGHKGQESAIEALSLEDINDEEQLLDTLYKMSPEELIKRHWAKREKLLPATKHPFLLVIEKPSQGAFISQHPDAIMHEGNYNRVPLIIGYNSAEGLLYKVFDSIYGEDNWNMGGYGCQQAIPHTWNLKSNSEKSKCLSKKIEKFYYGNEIPTKENSNIYFEILGDASFTMEILSTVENFLKISGQLVYLYEFSLQTELNAFKKLSKASQGVCHGDDIFYLFRSILTPHINANSIEEKSIQKVTELWTNFAKTSDPNKINVDQSSPSRWTMVNTSKLEYLHISNESCMLDNPVSQRRNFWKQIRNDL